MAELTCQFFMGTPDRKTEFGFISVTVDDGFQELFSEAYPRLDIRESIKYAIQKINPKLEISHYRELPHNRSGQ